MINAAIEPTFAAWRTKARELLKQGVRPDQVNWGAAGQGPGLLLEEAVAYAPIAPSEIKVPPNFLALAASVCVHTDEKRWSILYRLLYRLTLGGERHLLHLPSDPDTRQCQVWAKAVARDIHKIHAFVRFRLIGQDEATGREQFVAWFEPMFHSMRLAAPFFEKRFAGMDWSILTPDECVHWDGQAVIFTPGVDRREAPSADAHDDLWRTYYRSIFNPARLKVQAMQSEMPQKYWKNLPEAQIIRELIAGSQARVQDMLDTPERPAKPVPDNAYIRSLHERPDRS